MCSEGDEIDEIATPSPDIDIFAEPSDPRIRRAKLLRLFHGRSRLQRLNTINAKFGFGLYRSLRNDLNQTDNILLAPASISIAMGMMSLAAGAETRDQVYEGMGFAEFVNASHHYDNSTVHKLFRKLTHRLFRRNFGYTLRAVNDFYVRRDVPVRDDFRAQTKAFYFAEPQSVDFADPAFLSRANRRILKLTKGLIREPLKSVDPNMALMLLNYLYFKGVWKQLKRKEDRRRLKWRCYTTRLCGRVVSFLSHRANTSVTIFVCFFALAGTWEQKFPKEMTHYRNFRVNERSTVRVPMMSNKGNFLAAADHELDCDVLQVGGKNFSASCRPATAQSRAHRLKQCFSTLMSHGHADQRHN